MEPSQQAHGKPGCVPPAAPGTEGLSCTFLQSLCTLFDILDNQCCRCVHLCEIESGWRGTDTRDLPSGMLEGLRQLDLASGYLSFEYFVAGLCASLGPQPPQCLVFMLLRSQGPS